MAYSSTDLNNVENAIVNLATGARVQSVNLGGKTIEYGRADMEKLEKLRGRIILELRRNTTTNCIIMRTSKGL